MASKLSNEQLISWHEWIHHAPAVEGSSCLNPSSPNDHYGLLKSFENYFMTEGIQISDCGFVLRTNVGNKLPEVVQPIAILDATHLRLPQIIIGLVEISDNEDDKSPLTFFVEHLSSAKPLEQASKPIFLPLGGDLEKEIINRTYAPCGQSSAPLYGQYVRNDEAGVINFERKYQHINCGWYEFRAMIWMRLEPLSEKDRSSPERNDEELEELIKTRRLFRKSLEEQSLEEKSLEEAAKVARKNRIRYGGIDSVLEDIAPS